MTAKAGRYICTGCDGECNLIIGEGANHPPEHCVMGGQKRLWQHIDEWRKMFPVVVPK